jgi:outer membrane protein OmpA-like peptidoglycan-associated protein
LVGLAGCASASKALPQDAQRILPPAPADLVILLPDDDGRVGRAIVSNDRGSTDLSTAGGSTTVSATSGPAPERPMSDREIQDIFGTTLSFLPPASDHFTLLFQFESDAVTAESRRSLAAIVAAVRRHQPAQVAVVGHADSAGSSRANFDLGLRRAQRIRDLLVVAGVEASCIEVSSRGEADPAVRPGDDVLERRNRRVDVTVK